MQTSKKIKKNHIFFEKHLKKTHAVNHIQIVNDFIQKVYSALKILTENSFHSQRILSEWKIYVGKTKTPANQRTVQKNGAAQNNFQKW